MLAKETKLGKGSVHLISDNSSQFDSTLVYFIKLFPDEVPVTEDEFIDRTMAISYIETSIASFIKMSDYKVNLDQENYSDTRNATVVFLRFQNIQIGLGMNDSQTQPFVQSADLMRVHKISLEIIRCVHAEGGSLRQINVDDKGFTALAVWGLRGLAHQRGEAVYALSACINIFNGLNDGGEARSHFAFTAGVASGTVYAGLIGSDLRADGTVLGSPVNTAARMMCLEEPEWSTTADFPLIYCDTATYENARKEFEFLQDTRSVELKAK
ncbi:hypothetical protein DFJ73DRAFT_73416 [Zopfochytrium polystomum]|nr:hypothetical protein DFJ73DRAFT_73416 [Zopfochytrium polystomum]